MKPPRLHVVARALVNRRDKSAPVLHIYSSYAVMAKSYNVITPFRIRQDIFRGDFPDLGHGDPPRLRGPISLRIRRISESESCGSRNRWSEAVKKPPDRRNRLSHRFGSPCDALWDRRFHLSIRYRSRFFHGFSGPPPTSADWRQAVEDGAHAFLPPCAPAPGVASGLNSAASQ